MKPLQKMITWFNPLIEILTSRKNIIVAFVAVVLAATNYALVVLYAADYIAPSIFVLGATGIWYQFSLLFRLVSKLRALGFVLNVLTFAHMVFGPIAFMIAILSDNHLEIIQVWIDRKIDELF